MNVKFFVDDGISGTTFNRPGFQAMLAEVEEGNVVCYGKQIPEDALVAITKEVLGVEKLSDEVLRERLDRIVVTAPYQLL